MAWLTADGTLTGPQHTLRGLGNQDVADSVILPGDVAVLCLADGAGSLPRSAEGAVLAVAAATGHAAAGPGAASRADLADLVGDALAAGIDAVTSRPDAAELGCTLVVAAAAACGWAVAAVGDSFAVLTFGDGRHEVLRPPPAGEYANITKLVTSAALEPLYAGGDDAPVAVTVASDGLAPQALRSGSAHAGFFTPLVTHARSGTLDVAGLLEHMAGLERIDDDTTVRIAARPAGTTGTTQAGADTDAAVGERDGAGADRSVRR